MKKNIVKAASISLGIITAMASFGACGEKRGVGSNGKALEITVINKGLGYEWVEEIANLYSAEVGTYIEVIPDSNLDEGIVSKINNNPSDIYFTYNNAVQWVQWALTDKIVALDDVIEDSAFRTEEVAALGKYEGTRYTVPFPYSPTGFVYNQVLLDQINSYGEYEKGVFPTTWQGLLDLCVATKNAELKSAYGNTIVPMAAAGGVQDLNYIFKALWGQHDDTGFKAYYSQNDPENYDKNLLVNDGTVAAMTAIQELLGENGSNNFDNWMSKDNLQAQDYFCNGNAVFCVTGSWFANEQASLLAEIPETELDYHFATVPVVEGKQSTSFINLPGEYFMVTENGVNGDVEEAKNFLKYILKEENLKKIQSILQVPLAFNYSTEGVELTTWGKELDAVAKNTRGVISGTNTPVCLSGALDFNLYLSYQCAAVAKNTVTPQEAMTAIYDTLKVEYKETARKFFS